MDNIPLGYTVDEGMDEIDRVPYEEGIGDKCDLCDSETDFVIYEDGSGKWYTHECTNPECKYETDPEPYFDDDDGEE